MALNSSLELTLAVPMGLEDIAVTRLPQGLVDAAVQISYVLGTGYLTLAIPLDQPEKEVAKILSDLVQHPPLCLFTASITVGLISVPRSVFDAPKDLLSYLKNGFQAGDQESNSNSNSNDLNWQKALSIFKTSTTIPSTTIKASSQNVDQAVEASTTFRASFDRGTVQHKGVRSQDVAAALGALTGKVFPGWRVNLTEYDVEVVGRWVPETEPVFFKGQGTLNMSPRQDREIDKCEPGSVKRQKIEEQSNERAMVIQVGVALPLALSSCPYRYRPVDGRTSLKIEIAYTLLAMAGPKTGDIVLDVCAGVGTIPIVGAIHFPDSFFAGSEIVPSNVDKAAENARGMKAKVEETKGGKPSPQPSLFMGDAKAVCWRSGTVDLIVSDLPWGQRESSHVSNCKLYPKLVKQVIRLLRVGGRAVLVTGERKLLQRQLDSVFAKPFLQVVQRREITIGFSVMVFELRRI